jgi:hypothetical protein
MSNIICSKCGDKSHGESPSPDFAHCVTCTGDHPSSNNKCSMYLKEKEIQELKVKEGMTISEAQKCCFECKKTE